MIQYFLDEKERNYLHMSDRERNHKRIFQGQSHYGKYSQVSYFNKASQYCAFQLCQTTCRIDLHKFDMQIEGYNFRVDGEYVDASFPDLLLLQLQQIMKRKQKSPPTVIVPVPEQITTDEKS